MTIDVINDAAARFLTLSSALSALSYLIFFVLLDKGKTSIIKNHILIFVVNTYFIYISVFMHLSGFEFMSRPYHMFRAIMGLSSLLLCEAIFRRHAPRFYKVITLIISLGLFCILAFKSDIEAFKVAVNYYSIFHIFSLSIFIFVLDL